MYTPMRLTFKFFKGKLYKEENSPNMANFQITRSNSIQPDSLKILYSSTNTYNRSNKSVYYHIIHKKTIFLKLLIKLTIFFKLSFSEKSTLTYFPTLSNVILNSLIQAI